jgi:transposase-like protein
VPDNIIHLDESALKNQLSELVRGTVEETFNNLLDQEADRLTNASRYEHSEARKDTRAGYYNRKLLTKACEVDLKVPKLRHLPFEIASSYAQGNLCPRRLG